MTKRTEGELEVERPWAQAQDSELCRHCGADSPSAWLDPATMPDIVRQVARAAFPTYRGRKFRLRYADTFDGRSFWVGGSRDVFRVVRLSDFAVLPLPASHPTFDRVAPSVECLPVPDGAVVAIHSIFFGKDMGLTFLVPEHVGRTMLPLPSVELSDVERAVLGVTSAYKASYAGISDYRAHELQRKGYSLEDIMEARASLKARKLLNKAGAITVAGRNVL